jgi:hypothetical protein
MFGGGGMSTPAAKAWGDMYFHERLQHLIDHGADFIISKSKYWVPATAVGAAASLIMLGGPMGIPAILELAQAALVPMARPVSFGASMQEGGASPGADEYDDVDEDL